MDKQMYDSIWHALADHLKRGTAPASGLLACAAENPVDGEYIISENKVSLKPGDSLPDGNCVVTGKIHIPDEALPDGYERTFLVDFGRRDGQFFVNGELYHGVDANRRFLPIRDEWKGQTVDIKIIAKGNSQFGYLGTTVIDKEVQALLYTFNIVLNYFATEDGGKYMENRVIDGRM